MKKLINNILSVFAVALLFITATAAAQTGVQQVNKVIYTESTATASPASTRNKVAVMPINYIGEDNDARAEEMRFHLQEIAINCLSESAAELKFMDATEVNARLFKNGINIDNIRQYTPKELAGILNVEYIIMGSVLQDRGNVVTVSRTNNSRRQNVEHWGKWMEVNRRNSSSTASVTRQNIETHVSVSIYNETGEKIYTKSRQSILSDADAYKAAIKYLLKRTPLYRR
jgi:hypothetical protein